MKTENQDHAVVLLYHLTELTEKGALVGNLLRELDLPVRRVEPEELSLSLGQLCGMETAPAQRAAQDPPTGQECLVMCGLSEEQLNSLLGRLRGVDLPLKAIMTPHNRQWSFGALLEELTRENNTFLALRRLNGLMERALAQPARPDLADAIAAGKAALQARRPSWDDMNRAADALEPLLPQA